MRLDYQLEMRQSQKLLMTPQLRQALKLLQLPSMELSAYLEQQFLENPLLEIAEEQQEEEPAQESAAERELDFDWEPDFPDFASNDHRDKPTFEYYCSPALSLQNCLQQQLAIISAPAEQVAIVRTIIDSLSDDGYLHLSCADIAGQLRVKERRVLAALRLVQSFEPAGIGARSLQECLLLQIESRGDAPPFVREIVGGHLEHVAKGRIPILAEILGASYGQIQEAIDYIKSLEPKPGLALGEEGASPYIYPDVTLLAVSGKWVILVNDSCTCHLRLSPGYREMLANADSGTQKYLRDRLSSALWLLRAIEQRRNTLYRITEFILEYQQQYFSRGVKSLRPLRLKDVAEALSVHESTVSRAIKGKYLQTPRGTVAFRYFFAANIDTRGGDGIANTGVKQLIAEIIAAEEETEPLTDEQIALCLQARGIRISRRTVAKYRAELSIPGSTLRKRWQ